MLSLKVGSPKEGLARETAVERLKEMGVWMREVSVPAFGSVTPNDMTISPVGTRGRYFCLRAALPCLMSGMGGNM